MPDHSIGDSAVIHSKARLLWSSSEVGVATTVFPTPVCEKLMAQIHECLSPSERASGVQQRRTCVSGADP